jgi:formamidopyrimidine-DNA glycosylase
VGQCQRKKRGPSVDHVARAYHVPELPEVEVVVRELRRTVVGASIVGAEICWLGTIGRSNRDEFVRGVSGQRIVSVARRGKWITLALSSGKSLLVHLRMTGRLLVAREERVDCTYLRVRLLLGDGGAICFHDTRKFGRMLLVADARDVLAALGPEPLSHAFTEAVFRKRLAERRARIKPLLLDQSFLAGLGNIYTDEALWRAGIHPLRAANSLSADEAARLWRAIKTVLRGAIRAGGTTLDDGGFVGATGETGRFAPRLAVYGRAGEDCPRCGTAVDRIVVAQRGTHICPRCQVDPLKPPRSTADPDPEG